MNYEGISADDEIMLAIRYAFMPRGILDANDHQNPQSPYV